ncbi:MAG: hypothetical protein IPL08_19865 [Saprospiraceae bacterium]|nr:hypothetical protein [Saprospiraceae bacterium]
MTGKGGFSDFYESFGFGMDHFEPIGKSSIHYTIKNLSPEFRTIFVHNTLTTKEDVRAASLWNKNIFWATAPMLIYTENRLRIIAFSGQHL